VIIYLFIRQVKKIITNDKNNHLFIAATASLICIVVGGLVSYPLQIFPIVFQFIVCLAIINTYSSADKIRIELPEKLKRIPIIIFALLGFYLIVYFYSNFQFSRKNLEAFEFERMGYRQNALKVYKELGNSVIKDGNMLYSYAKALYYSNQPIRAAQVLKVAKKYYCSNAVYKLSAQINQELGNHHQAEKDYQTAVYMVPNRMISRYDLLNYYIEQKDTSNIIYWSHSIAKMPVKVPSQLAKGLQMKAKTILFQYNKRNSLDSIK
jgi:tetratricopeptide (TPR) repeat protein